MTKPFPVRCALFRMATCRHVDLSGQSSCQESDGDTQLQHDNGSSESSVEKGKGNIARLV